MRTHAHSPARTDTEAHLYTLTERPARLTRLGPPVRTYFVVHMLGALACLPLLGVGRPADDMCGSNLGAGRQAAGGASVRPPPQKAGPSSSSSSRPAQQPGAQLWVEKHKPHHMNELVGNKTVVQTLREWLESW